MPLNQRICHHFVCLWVEVVRAEARVMLRLRRSSLLFGRGFHDMRGTRFCHGFRDLWSCVACEGRR